VILEFLRKKNINISEEVQSKFPKLTDLQMNLGISNQLLHSMDYNIEFRHMSLQDTVDFAMFLTTITYGRQRFVSGIPTVGGKVNLATITIKDGFRLLTPKEISVPTINI